MENKTVTTRIPIHWRKGEQLPEGAVILRPEQVFAIHKRNISNWKPWYAAWSFHFGHIILGASTGVTSMFTVMRYRQALNLMNYAFPSTMIIGAVMPSVLATVGNKMLISERLLRSDGSHSLEIETLAGLLQFVLGGIYPFILAPISCAMQAQNYNTFAVPSWQEKREYMSIIKKILPFKRVALPILGFHFSIGMFIGQQQFSFFEKLTAPDALKSLRGRTSEDITFN